MDGGLDFTTLKSRLGLTRLKDFKCEPDRDLASAIISNQQNGGTLRHRQFAILQTAEIMHVKSSYHAATILPSSGFVQLEFGLHGLTGCD